MNAEGFTKKDLKAFERRLTEVIVSLNPSATRYRCIFVFMSICSVYGAILWLGDNDTFKTTLVQSLLNHMFFTISSIIMLLLLMGGIHRKVVAPSIIISRVRMVLADYNMSCDDTGKLILKPRPTS